MIFIPILSQKKKADLDLIGGLKSVLDRRTPITQGTRSKWGEGSYCDCADLLSCLLSLPLVPHLRERIKIMGLYTFQSHYLHISQVCDF